MYVILQWKKSLPEKVLCVGVANKHRIPCSSEKNALQLSVYPNPKKNFLQLCGSRNRNFTILKSRESESNGNKARESESELESN